jgi:multimeric flavodoxin WrbA
MGKILAINGSYRKNGITDQAVEEMVRAVESAGAEVEVVLLRKQAIEFCLNCRECTQRPGDAPGACVLRDGMEDLINRIERADGYILAAPTNFGSVTALYKRFMERLIVYAYWPWEKNSPSYRKAKAARKKSVLISSCAAPGILARFTYETRKQLKMTSVIIGADVVGTLFIGLIAKDPHRALPDRHKRKIKRLAEKLL